MWILTREINEYDQDGAYFVHAWLKKPSHKELAALGVDYARMKHTLDGGGRTQASENEWFYLFEIKDMASTPLPAPPETSTND